MTTLLMTGCATNGPEIKIVDNYCKMADAIYISKDDTLTPDTARQILFHNELWQRFCVDKKPE